MEEGEAKGVETLSPKAGDRLLGAVYCISQQRVSQTCHVDPDLMGAARFQTALEIGVSGIVCQSLPVGHCLSSLREDRHFFSVGFTSANGKINSKFIVFYIFVNKSYISSVRLCILPLLCKGQVGFVCFCNN